MSQLLDVGPVVLTVELLEDRYDSVDVVRTIYRELDGLVLPLNRAQELIILQVLEHA